MKMIATALAASMLSLLADDTFLSTEITKNTVASFYCSFPRLTERPRVVSAALRLLCGEPSSENIEKHKALYGPHYFHSIHIYCSPQSQTAFKAPADPMPVGTIVVKEKLDHIEAVKGIGGMIKRAEGYDSEGGDWEYFYFDSKVGFSTGKLANCRSCHARAKDRDFVFTRGKTT
jgi:Cytochrome P460